MDLNSARQQIVTCLVHPLGILLLTFLLTGVGATAFSKWLDNRSTARQLAISSRQQALESVRSVTDLLSERRARGTMLSSAIVAPAPLEDIKARKAAYDDVFVRYNTSLLSNLFRMRSVFHTTEPTAFEKLLTGPIRNLLVAQDDCLTAAYNAIFIKSDGKNTEPSNILADCKPNENPKLSVGAIEQATVGCLYSFSDGLFHIAQITNWVKKDNQIVISLAQNIAQRCQFPTPH